MKTIVVPKTEDAMRRLDFNESRENDLLELSLDDLEYNDISQSGLFQIINKELEIYIDDYEDESVTDLSKMIKMKEIMGTYIEKNKNIVFLYKFLNIVDQAIVLKTGIFFYF